MPLGKWFDKILSGGQKPIVVSWSETNPDHSISGVNDEIKQIIQDEIFLTVTAPTFSESETSFKFLVSNMSSRALGFGALGVGLVTTKNGLKSTQPCRGLAVGFLLDRLDGQELRQNVMVDAGDKAEIVARFGAVPKGERADLLIQANRIGAASYLFTLSYLSTAPRTRISSMNGHSAMQARECSECHARFYTSLPDRLICDACGLRKQDKENQAAQLDRTHSTDLNFR